MTTPPELKLFSLKLLTFVLIGLNGRFAFVNLVESTRFVMYVSTIFGERINFLFWSKYFLKTGLRKMSDPPAGRKPDHLI
jgi:hypothetical protein